MEINTPAPFCVIDDNGLFWKHADINFNNGVVLNFARLVSIFLNLLVFLILSVISVIKKANDCHNLTDLSYL